MRGGPVRWLCRAWVAPAVFAALAGWAAAAEPSSVRVGGRITRPQLTAGEAHAYSYREVLGPWDPLSDPAPTPTKPDYIVDRNGEPDGRRTFRTVQAAVNAAVARDAVGADRVHIQLRPGTYDELVYVPDMRVPITLYGDGANAAEVRVRAKLDATMTGESYARTFGAAFAAAPPAVVAMFESLKARATIGTPGSTVAWIRASGFQARNLTIENAHNKDRGDHADQSQAVALMLDDADRARLENVRLIGFQDTLYLSATSADRPARAFIHRSYVEGDMDFIFGEGTGYFLATEIRSLGDRAVSYALAPSTHYRSRHGFVFEACRFTHDGTPNAHAGAFKLARQWNRKPEAVGKVAILNSSIGSHIDALRPWSDWSIGTPRYRPVQYDADEHWERLRAAGVDPVRDLGYPPRRSPAEPFLVEYNNTNEANR